MGFSRAPLMGCPCQGMRSCVSLQPNLALGSLQEDAHARAVLQKHPKLSWTEMFMPGLCYRNIPSSPGGRCSCQGCTAETSQALLEGDAHARPVLQKRPLPLGMAQIDVQEQGRSSGAPRACCTRTLAELPSSISINPPSCVPQFCL